MIGMDDIDPTQMDWALLHVADQMNDHNLSFFITGN